MLLILLQILPKAPTILAELGKLKEQNEPGDDCQQRFIVILTGLMIRFPNPDYQYRELVSKPIITLVVIF